MAFPAAPTDAQLYTTADGRVYKYTLASDTWDYQSVQDIAALNNNAGATPPTATDDSTAGYAPSSLWVDVVAQKVYVNMSATPAAAVWNELTSNITVAASAPLTPMLGSMYLNTTSGFVFVWNGTAWVDVTSAGVSVKNNFAGTVAPVVANDSSATQGYSIGSVWIDTVTDTPYICLDATVGAAIWVNIAAALIQNNYNAILAPTATDDAAAGYSAGSRWLDTVTGTFYALSDATATAAVWKQLNNAATATLGSSVVAVNAILTSETYTAAASGASGVTGQGFVLNAANSTLTVTKNMRVLIETTSTMNPSISAAQTILYGYTLVNGVQAGAASAVNASNTNGNGISANTRIVMNLLAGDVLSVGRYSTTLSTNSVSATATITELL